MFFSHLHCGDVGYFFNEVSHVSLSFTLWGHLSLFALWGHRTTLKSVMFFFHLHCGDIFSHLHCGDIGHFFKEDSHVSLSYTLYVGHCSLIYTVGTFLSLCTVGIKDNFRVIDVFLSSTLWGHFSLIHTVGT